MSTTDIETILAQTSGGPPLIEVVNCTKRFGSMTALDHVSMELAPGAFHALLGGNGAGKSTLVKCLMGFYLADEGQFAVNGHEVTIKSTRDARAMGIGMVYQHFTLVQNMTVAENLMICRDDVPMRIRWKQELADLEAFMKTMPFKVPLHVPVRSLAAGEKQKLEILKQLYLKTKVLILDEPTSVLTPQEADEVLGLVHQMTLRKEISVLIITHKFREVMQYASDITVLRHGKYAGGGKASELTTAQLAEMMVGKESAAKPAQRAATATRLPRLQISGVCAEDDLGLPALESIDLTVFSGEIVGVAGVSGNGQSELMEVIAGQRRMSAGSISVSGKPYNATRGDIAKLKIHCLPEEPLRNTCVGRMTVTQNIAFRTFDRQPHAVAGVFLRHGAIKQRAQDLIARYRVKTASPDSPIRTLSGGNVQRAVLARELADPVDVLVVANPCFGLDFAAAGDIRSQLMEARNRGAAVLLISEDLDEILELADRIVVMFEGQIAYETPAATASTRELGRYMAGHGAEA